MARGGVRSVGLGTSSEETVEISERPPMWWLAVRTRRNGRRAASSRRQRTPRPSRPLPSQLWEKLEEAHLIPDVTSRDPELYFLGASSVADPVALLVLLPERVDLLRVVVDPGRALDEQPKDFALLRTQRDTRRARARHYGARAASERGGGAERAAGGEEEDWREDRSSPAEHKLTPLATD